MADSDLRNESWQGDEHHELNPDPPPLPSTARRARGPTVTEAGQWMLALPKRFYTQNPFYLISACLVFYGVYAACQSNTASASTASDSRWWLFGILTGYTLLMALTAVVIVRFGKVWDDARSVVMTVFLLLLATSTSLDEIGVRFAQNGQPIIPLVLIAFGCAMAISELLIRGMGVRLSWRYRLPYGLVLGAFYLYPLGGMLLQRYGYANDVPTLGWYVLGFPLLQALCFLTLIPAIRRGAAEVSDRRTPWRWPAFPLLVFAMAAVGVCVRQYFLTFSFMPAKGMETAFGLYSLLPMLLAGAVLLIELARLTQSKAARLAGLLIPLAAVPMALSGAHQTDIYARVLRMVVDHVGSPVLLALFGAAVVYVYAWARRLRGAKLMLIVTLLATTLVAPYTTGLHDLVSPQPWPLALVAVITLALLLQKRTAWRLFVAGAAAIMGATLLHRGTWFTSGWGVAPLHLLLLTALVAGLLPRDRFATFLQRVCAGAMPGLVFACIVEQTFGTALPGWVAPAYAGSMVGLAFGYWALTRNRLFLYGGWVALAALLVYLTGAAYKSLQEPDRPRGLVPLFWGGLSFVAALIISLLKGGILQKAMRRIWPPPHTH